MKHINILFILIIGALLPAAWSCSSGSDKIHEWEQPLGDFQLESSADTLRSYADGGGVLVIRLDPDSIFNNTVTVSYEADTVLHAVLSEATISNSHPITELSIRPGATDIDTFHIVITGTCETLVRTVALTVVMSDFAGTVPQEFIDARDDIIHWVVVHYPEHTALDGMIFRSYRRLTGVVGSTSWAFLNSSWHLWVVRPTSLDPPYTMYLRYRGEWDCCLTVRKNADGSIVEL